MIVALLTTVFLFAPSQATTQISDAQKKTFIEFLKTLPHKGEFFTDEAVTKADPYLPLLFALTEKDTEEYDVYPFSRIKSRFVQSKEAS